MTRTVVFVHGGWVTPRCWDPFVSHFASRGFRTLAPAWPGKDRSVDAIREDPSPLVGLGIEQIVDHYERIARSLDEPCSIDTARPGSISRTRTAHRCCSSPGWRTAPCHRSSQGEHFALTAPHRFGELRTFPGRTHWIIAQPGWEEVADSCIDWIASVRRDPPAE